MPDIVERCKLCESPTHCTGQGKDSLYVGTKGPLCGDCFDEVQFAHRGEECPECSGIGEIQKRMPGGSGHCDPERCDKCDGTGRLLGGDNSLMGAMARLRADNKRLRDWVSDCQSSMYVNCVYCGHRYGPDKDTPVAMADILKQHIAVCREHPMAALVTALRTAINSIECASICSQTGEELPWCKQAKKALKGIEADTRQPA